MECNTLKRSPDGSCVLTIYPEDGEKITYSITKRRIVFTMYKVAIVLEKECFWNVKDLQCEEVDIPLKSIMTLLGHVRMIALYNIDTAWRCFCKTRKRAEDVAETIEDYLVCRPNSELNNVELSPEDHAMPEINMPRIDSLTAFISDDSRSPSLDSLSELTYIRRETPHLEEAIPEISPFVP